MDGIGRAGSFCQNRDFMIDRGRVEKQQSARRQTRVLLTTYTTQMIIIGAFGNSRPCRGNDCVDYLRRRGMNSITQEPAGHVIC